MLSNDCSNLRVSIKSIGCRTNQEEMTTLRFQLENAGFTLTDSVEDANVVIVNTCAVTSGTESKTRRLMNVIASTSSEARILVTGCLAQQKPDELKDMRNVMWVVGNTYKNDILSILQCEEGIFHSSFDSKDGNILPLDSAKLSLQIFDNANVKTRFPVKIQEGCNFKCSYCIVPSLRGPSRSAPTESIQEVCKDAVKAGYKELVLTGTHIGQYGIESQSNLVALLHSLLGFEGDFRIRLSSLDPRDLSDELMDMVGNNDRICDHLHVSLQSLSPEVLEKMNRPYEDMESMIDRLITFRKNFPDAGLGTDLIVGYPGESDECFYETIDNVKKIGFSYAHIFRYSIRPGTAAAILHEHVSETVKSNRSAILRNVIEEGRKLFIKKNHGITKRIIVESEEPVRGLTSNYLHVEIPGYKGERNTWLDVSVVGNYQGRFCLAETSNM